MGFDSHSTTAPAPRPLNARRRRALIEQTMERLLAAVEAATAALDALDGDPDLEPSLAFPEAYARGFYGLIGDRDEREEACEDEGADTGDAEHSLGWSESEGRIGRLGFPTSDGEPSLGSSGELDQRRWVHRQHSSDREAELEAQCEDEGWDGDREPDTDAEPDEPPFAPDYHPEDQRLVATGGFADEVFYRHADTGDVVRSRPALP